MHYAEHSKLRTVLPIRQVVNHVAATSGSTFQASGAYGPFNSTTESYHPFCWITDYTNQTQVEDCEWVRKSFLSLVPETSHSANSALNQTTPFYKPLNQAGWV